MLPRSTTTAIALTHGLVGWGLCGVTMGVAMSVTTLKSALIIHAVAAPAIFVGISSVYFRRFASASPLRTAAQFLAVVIAMDFLIVALLIQRSFKMSTSALGTWLPFLFIFVATWWTGAAIRRATGHPFRLPTIESATKVVGLALTVACWFWARDLEQSEAWNAVLIWCAPLFQYPITMFGRRSWTPDLTPSALNGRASSFTMR